MPQNGFMGENNRCYGSIEPRRDRPGNAAADIDISGQAKAQSVLDKTAQCRTKMNQRAVLTDGSPPLAETNAASVEPKPALTSSSLSLRWAA